MLELPGKNLMSVLRDPPQFLYCTAENVLQTPFLGELKNNNTAIHKAVSAIVVDESHTVESWTGKRCEEKESCAVVIYKCLKSYVPSKLEIFASQT